MNSKPRAVLAYAKTAQCPYLLHASEDARKWAERKVSAQSELPSACCALSPALTEAVKTSVGYMRPQMSCENPHAGLTAQLKSPTTASLTSGMVLHSSLPL